MNSLLHVVRLTALASLLGACGPGPNNFNGTVAGTSLIVQRAVLINSGAGATGMSISLSSRADVCDYLKARVDPLPSFLMLFEGTSSGSYPVFKRADYGDGRFPRGKVWGNFASPLRDDQPASAWKPAEISEGTVQIDSVVQGAGAVVKGSFDVKFGADRATGTFEATPCPP